MSKALMGIFWGVFSIPKGLCMVIGGIRHQEQRFNSRSAGVSSALLFLSVGGELGTGVSPGLGDPTRVGAHPMSCPCRCLCPDALLQGVWEAGLWRVPQRHPEPAGPLPLPQLSL